MIATAGIDNTLIGWDARTGKEKFRITELENHKIDAVEFSPDPESRLLAFSGEGGGKTEMSLMHLDTKERQSIPVSYRWSLTFSPDGKTLYCGCEGYVELYEIPSLRLLSTLKGSGGPVPNVTFSRDEMTLAIPSWGGYVQLWNRKVNAEVGRLPLPVDSMASAKFSPDGSQLVVSTWGNGVYVFRAPTLEQIAIWQNRERSASP
jgi:WD40 repeat protein